MKITVQDIKFVNWDEVRESIKEECLAKIAKTIGQAGEEFAKLKPGQRKSIPIKVGVITISKAED